MIKNKNHGGFIDRQGKGVGMEEEANQVLSNLFLCFALGHLPVFSKRMKRKIKCLCTGYYLQFCLICSSLNG